MTAHEPHPHMRIVRGDPTAEEVAALVAVLAAVVGPAGEEAPDVVAPPSRWAPPERMLRQSIGPTGWWESSLPR